MKKRGKAQASMEFLMIIGFLTMVLVPLILLFFSRSVDYGELASESQLQKVTEDIISNVEKVYYYGDPSKTTLKFSLPDKIESAEVRDFEIVYHLRKRSGVTEVYSTTDVNMTGTLPTTPGIHSISIESKGTYVEIS